MSDRPAKLAFDVLHTDGAARCGRLNTPHGDVATPVFMPVGTQAAVKGLDVAAVRATGSRMLLGNTYHLSLRPGEEVVRDLGGLHRFMGWDGPILTDSGGFQLFSLAQMTKITEQEATFRSHIDGRLIHLSPERAIEIQEALGSDVAMVLDHVIALPATGDAIADATERTIRWAERCRQAHRRGGQSLFAIVQGGLDIDLRLACTRRLAEMDFDGHAIGGLSVGETPEQMHEILRHTAGALPSDRPRYLMGVGRPQDLLEAIRHGIDMFDCVLPTRNGRNAMAFTDAGTLRLRNLRHERDPRPLEEHCPCAACRHSRSYLRHLFMAGEMLGPILLTIHNLTYYQRLMADARAAIQSHRFAEFHAEKLRGWERAPELL
jgi:queuine tRNA-ribosyltransferase